MRLISVNDKYKLYWTIGYKAIQARPSWIILQTHFWNSYFGTRFINRFLFSLQIEDVPGFRADKYLNWSPIQVNTIIDIKFPISDLLKHLDDLLKK